MNDINKLYDVWKQKCTDPALKKDLAEIEGNKDEILDRFYRDLQFGTAGLRGVLGAGTNRMNIYTVGAATQGVADYINAEFKVPSVAIAYDSRINSDVFAKRAAGIFAANGIKVWIYKELVPTPMLSFAVRELRCASGVIITASHNPSKYNGYKCYDPSGFQMTDEAADEAYAFIKKVDMFDDVKYIDFDKGLAEKKIEYVPDEVIEKFYTLVMSKNIDPDACAEADLKVIYTPLNGTGNKPVREILSRIGVKNVTVVPSQELPDGNFPTCPFPNPEIKQAFEQAIELSQSIPADLLVATDPDCDRMGIAVNHNGKFVLMSGNEVGAMFTEYVLSQYKAKGIMPKDPVVVKSIVTTSLVEKIAASYGAEVKNTLTGFKYIGEFVTQLEAKGRASSFIIGMEESYGYLLGTHARDKDAVVASMLVCEMASYYKLKGMDLVDVMESLYKRYGIFINRVESFEFDGASGMQKMAAIMDGLRAHPLTSIAGEKVISVIDYEDSASTGLPASNVLSYKLATGGMIVRPSGTEPKIKFYMTATADSREQAEKIYTDMVSDAKTITEE
jgi:phosphoglucomutase